MLRSTLVLQLLTFFLDTQGADAKSVMELFPEEFMPRVQRSERPPRADFPWAGASADLTDSIWYLAERRLIRITPDGRVAIPKATADVGSVPMNFSPSEPRAEQRDEGFGFVPLLEWTGDRVRLPEHAQSYDFEEPRFEV